MITYYTKQLSKPGTFIFSVVLVVCNSSVDNYGIRRQRISINQVGHFYRYETTGIVDGLFYDIQPEVEET